ncbi:MAG: RNA polymerase sigma factor [Planctomycetota bacterium]
MTDSDAQMMVRFQRGDDGAFNYLVEKFHPQVINIIYRFLGRINDAEDLAQDVFVKVYGSKETYKPTAKFSTWLYRIVANHCLNWRRDESRVKKFSLDRDDPTGTRRAAPLENGKSSGPAEQLERDELQAAVLAAVNALPENQRMAVILDRYRGLPYREIGEVLEISEKAVKSLMARARENLRRLLARFVE